AGVGRGAPVGAGGELGAGVVHRGGPGRRVGAAAGHVVHVRGPVPVRPRVGVGRAGHLVVADDAGAVLRDAVLVGQVAGERGRGPVHRVGEPGRVADPAFVLDADGAVVVGGVPGVPGHVLVAHHLGDGAVGGLDHVVGRDVGAGVLEPGDRARVRALGDVDDDPVDVVAALAAGRAVVAGVGRNPRGGRLVGAGDGGSGVEVADLGVLAAVGGDLLRLDGDRAGLDAEAEELVDGVGVQAGGLGGGGVAVLGDGLVPAAGVLAGGLVEAELVGVRAQDGGGAADVGGVVALQRLGGQAGELGGFLERLVGGVVDEVHEPVAAAGAGLTVVSVEVGLRVAEGDEPVTGDVVLGGGLDEGVGEGGGAFGYGRLTCEDEDGGEDGGGESD